MSAVSSMIAALAGQGCPVSFPGPLSKVAAEAFCQTHDVSLEALPQQGWEGVLDDVMSGKAMFGILPIEHSVSGMIIQTVDFLFAHHKELQIVHELPVEDNLSLMGKVTRVSDARSIYSHQSLLDGCKGLLKSLPDAVAVPTATTAAAIARAAAEGDAMVICPESAGAEQGLAKLINSCSDDHNAETRYVIVTSRKGEASPIHLMPSHRSTRQCMYVHLDPQPGSLLKIMSLLFAFNADVCTITSRPPHRIGSTHFKNYFYIEFELPAGTTPAQATRLSGAIGDVALNAVELSIPGGHVCEVSTTMQAVPAWQDAISAMMS